MLKGLKQKVESKSGEKNRKDNSSQIFVLLFDRQNCSSDISDEFLVSLHNSSYVKTPTALELELEGIR